MITSALGMKIKVLMTVSYTPSQASVTHQSLIQQITIYLAKSVTNNHQPAPGGVKKAKINKKKTHMNIGDIVVGSR